MRESPASPHTPVFIRLSMTALDRALQQFQAGRPREAERVCREVLAHDLANAAALHLLGVLAHQSGRTAEAVALVKESRG